MFAVCSKYTHATARRVKRRVRDAQAPRLTAEVCLVRVNVVCWQIRCSILRSLSVPVLPAFVCPTNETQLQCPERKLI